MFHTTPSGNTTKLTKRPYPQ
uniref:Uncharacterized protein n=1 Tax=Arundo donax TaxID=35708 RepID=A0A0A8XQ18_ARUDO